jgi:hypothetical protein
MYKAGHEVHYIQAWVEGDFANYRSGTLLTVADDGWITVDVDGVVLRFWNHDPAWVRQCFVESAGQVGLPGGRLLYAPHAVGRYDAHYCISVATEVTPCPPARAELAEQVISLVKLGERWDFIETAIMESERIDSILRYCK